MKQRLNTLWHSFRSRQAPPAEGQDGIVLTPEEARQGKLGIPVLVVLALSMGLVLLSFVFLFAITD